MTDHEPAPVPWPGIEPAPFEFPSAEAAAARTALVELHTELTDCGSIHNNAFFDLSVGNRAPRCRSSGAPTSTASTPAPPRGSP